jgi:hypothetical protein
MLNAPSNHQPFASINISGAPQSTDDCKALLALLPSTQLGVESKADDWKRTSKFGSAPMVYRVFQHRFGVYALVVETRYQLAVVYLDSDVERTKHAVLSMELQHYVLQPIPKDSALEGAAPVASMQAPDAATWNHLDKNTLVADADVLDAEDHFDPAEVQAFQTVFKNEFHAGIRRGNDSSDAFYEALVKYQLMASDPFNSRKKPQTQEYLLRRKALAGLFRLEGVSDMDGNLDTEDECMDDEAIAGTFLDVTNKLEPDQPHWIDQVWWQGMEDLNETCEILVHCDSTVQDLDDLVSRRIKIYVWAIERGFQVPNAPKEATTLVEQRRALRATLRKVRQ